MLEWRLRGDVSMGDDNTALAFRSLIMTTLTSVLQRVDEKGEAPSQYPHQNKDDHVFIEE